MIMAAAMAFGLAGRAIAQEARPSSNDDPARLFAHAMQLIDEHAYASAVQELEDAYRLKPDPLVLYNIGIACAAMDAHARSVDALERFLEATSGSSSALRTKAESRLAEQSRLTGNVLVESEPAGDVVIDGGAVGKTPARRRLDPGIHIVVVTSPSSSQRRVIDLKSGSTEHLMIVFPPAAEKPSGRAAASSDRITTPTPVNEREHLDGRWPRRAKILLAATTVLAASAGALALWNAGRYSEWQQESQQLTSEQSPAQERLDLNSRLSSIQTMDKAAIALGVAAAALGGVTAYALWSHPQVRPALTIDRDHALAALSWCY
jgi:hypothetical protein